MKNLKKEYHLSEIESIVNELANLLHSCKVMTFTGPLGAGKTTLVRILLTHLGIKEPITSPTFTYVNCYETDDGSLFYHFDLYRISSLETFMHMGFEEYLYQPTSWAFIEWPEKILPLLTHDVCHIHLDYGADEQTRNITINCIK